MSFLKNALDENEPDENKNLEEQYLKLFPKMGRDFVHKDDMFSIIEVLLRLVDPLGVVGNPVGDIGARRKALEYKIALESGIDTTKLYSDLINLDD